MKESWIRSGIGQEFGRAMPQSTTASDARIDAPPLALSVGVADRGGLRGSYAQAVQLARSGAGAFAHASRSAAGRCAPNAVCDLLVARLALAGRARNQAESRAVLAIVLRQWCGGGTRYADAVPARGDHQDTVDSRPSRQRLAARGINRILMISPSWNG